MTKSNRRILSLGVAGLGLILLGSAIWFLVAGVSSSRAAQPTDFTAIPAKVDYPAPSLSLRGLEGGQHALSDYAGQVVLVNLWATWCPPCAAEMPNFQRFYQRHHDEGFVVVAINDGETSEDVAAFVTRYGLTFPVWLDPTFQATDHAFKTSNLPTSYVMNRTGRVSLMWIGAISESNLEKYVGPMIKE